MDCACVGDSVTLRRTIAAALRTGAEEAAKVARDRVAQWERERSASPDRLARLDGIGRLVDACRSVADLLDPGERIAHGDADTGAVPGHHRHSHPEAGAARGAPLDGAGRERLRGAAVAAGKDARVGGSHEPDATTSPLRFVKGGRA